MLTRRLAQLAVVCSSCALVAALGFAAQGHASGAQSPAFRGAFDAGSVAPWIPQAANFGYVDNPRVHFGTVRITSRLVGQGRFGARFDLPAWSGGRTRSQLITQRAVDVGEDDYYSLMAFFPRGWRPGTTVFWGVSIAELDFQGLGMGMPSIALQAHADHVTVAVATGVAGTAFPYYQYRSNADSTGRPNLPPLYAIPRPMKLGVWHELVVHVHWATDATGAIDVWHRLKGGRAWTKTASLSGSPTLQTNADGSVRQITHDVLQAYRGPSFAPTTLWLDGFTRDGSFAAAAHALP